MGTLPITRPLPFRPAGDHGFVLYGMGELGMLIVGEQPKALPAPPPTVSTLAVQSKLKCHNNK